MLSCGTVAGTMMLVTVESGPTFMARKALPVIAENTGAATSPP